jgi:hypothetical protein
MKYGRAIAAAVIGLASLAGCGKTSQNNAAPSPSTTPAVQATAQPDTPTRNLAYYQAHLDEAKDTWDKCVAMAPEAITEQVRMRCDTAHTAWSTQPYKPQPSTFSSSGGKH